MRRNPGPPSINYDAMESSLQQADRLSALVVTFPGLPGMGRHPYEPIWRVAPPDLAIVLA